MSFRLNNINLQKYTAACFITYIAFYGVIKYLLLAINEYANYSPQLLLTGASIALFLLKGTRAKITILLVFCYLFIEILNGSINHSSYSRVILGLWALFPLFLGYLCNETLSQHQNFWVSLFLILLISSVFGLVADVFIDLPWGSLKIDSLGGEVALTREARYIEVSRLAGFGGNHLNTSSVLVFSSIYILLFSSYNLVVKSVIYSVTLIALILTLNKSLIGAYLILGLLFIAPNKSQRLSLNTTIISFSILSLLLPLISYFYQGGVILSNFLKLPLLKTISTRWETYWPYMIDLLEKHSFHPFGIGIGSFGMASLRHQGIILSSGDNAYLYLYANLGIAGLIFYLLVLIQSPFKPYTDLKFRNFYLSTAACISIYGLMVNIIEIGIFGFFLGALAQNTLTNPIRKSRFYQNLCNE